MDSNPTPRASNVGSIKEINKDFIKVISEAVFYNKEEMTLQNLQKTKQYKKISKSADLEQKIDSITKFNLYSVFTFLNRINSSLGKVFSS